MSISEKDLFTFVFYPDKLQKSKYDFIIANLDMFSSELDLLIDLKTELNTPLDSTIVKKIKENIKTELEYNEIILIKEQKRIDFHSNDFLLAAASTHTHSNKTETFIDAKNQFLAKIVFNTYENQLFLFSNNQQDNQEILLKMLPSNRRIICKMKEFPLSIPQDETIDKIILNVI